MENPKKSRAQQRRDRRDRVQARMNEQSPINPAEKWCDRELEEKPRSLNERFDELFRLAGSNK